MLKYDMILVCNNIPPFHFHFYDFNIVATDK